MTSMVDMQKLLIFMMGTILGSFYNVVIYRLPRGESLVFPRSHCPRCSEVIAWFDNIPILSYLLLRGRCRKCGERISITYPLVEAVAGLLLLLIWDLYGISLKALWIYSFAVILLMITFIDWHHKIIPDVLSLGGIVLGWAGSAFQLHISLIDSFIGSLIGASVLVLVAFLYKMVRKIDGLGGGDVKLMAMIGAFLGWKMIFPVLFIASFLGSIYGLYLIRSGGSAKTAVAFGTFLSPSAFVVLCFGGKLWALYLNIYLH